jgi:replicative DNA helicase
MGALRMLELSRDETTTDTSIYSRAADIVADLEPKTVRRELGIVEILNNIADEIQERVDDEKSGRPNRITTGMECLDDVLYGGMAPGNLVIVSARPSVGKTALSLHMVRKAAEQGAKAVFFSIEMTTEELAMRMISSVTEEYEDENYLGIGNPRRSLVSMYKIANGFDSEDDWNRFETAVGRLDKLPITINDAARDLRDIVSRMTVLNKQGRCDVAYIDYLGLIKQAQADPRTPLYQVIADITATLKATAKSLRIPIVLLCQLNRDAAKASGSPQLYNLRDSGSIEQDADVVLMLNQVPGPAGLDLEVIVRKNRQGEKDFGILMRPSDNYMDFTEIGVTKP